MSLIPVVLSGGSGTRLWPVSRANHPKQFCKLLEESLQTMTLKRLRCFEDPLIVTSEKLRVLTEKEIATHQFSVRQIIYETEGKNTAPAVAIACRYLELTGASEQICGVFSSDALITKSSAFESAITEAKKAAGLGKVVVLGIHPDRVETGFGYIHVKDATLGQAAAVLKFHEKPDQQTAQKFIQEGTYFWNAGIFIFKVSRMVQDFKTHQPEMWKIITELKSDLSNIKDIYAQVKSISFDYAIIEKLATADLSCVPCDIGWSDLGSWDVLEQINSGSEKLPLSQQPFGIDSKGSVVFSNEKKTYGLVGVDDLIVVDTADALLVCKKGDSQKVKELVDQIKVVQKKSVEEQNFEIRPWGRFEILRDEKYFKSKIISVEPGQKISYQSHEHRAEHWVIVQGEATVVIDEQEHLLSQGQHIFIPKKAKHRIINSSVSVVEFIEVQVVTSFEESDIVRYHDDYGRR